MLARLVAYVRGIVRRRRIDAEIEEELRFHLEQEIDAHLARGASHVDARRMALRSLGGLVQTSEAVRDVRAVWFDRVARDVRHALRSLRATPAFTTAAVVVLTLSIGATTAIYSVVDAVVLRGLPFDESERLVAVGEVRKESSRASLNLTTPQTFLDWQSRQNVFTGMAAVAYAEISLKRDGNALPENVRAQQVSADFFSVLRTPPLIGRTFSPSDGVEGRAPVAVISFALWQRRFGGSPDVVGASLLGERVAFEIVGVMPREFTYPVDTYVLGAREPIDVWVPYVFSNDERVRGNRFGYSLHVLARLRDDVRLEQAQAGMDVIMSALAAETPRWYEDSAVRVERLHDFVTRGVRTWMLMLLGAVACVLVIACVNLASLMLVRATSRSRELGIRAALGASRWDLSRILLIESLVLSLTGALIGALVAWWGVDALRAAIPAEVPRAAMIAVNIRVLAATAILAVLAGLAFGLAPLAQISRPTAGDALRHGQRAGTVNARTATLRATLVVAEAALAVVLLVGAGLFAASFARVNNVDLGLEHEDVLSVQIRTLERATDPERMSQRNRQLLSNVLDRVRALPGVEVASLVGGGVPLRGDLRTVIFGIPGRELPKNTDISLNEISPDYFRTVNIPLLSGRFFAEGDTQNSQPVVILNEMAAERYFGGDDPLGKVVQLAGARTVVGIVGNVRHDGPEQGWRSQAFIPLPQSRVLGATLLVRTALGAQGVPKSVREVIWSEFPNDVPTRIDEHAMQFYFDALVAERRFNMLLLSTFGILGLVIACVGIYGVMAYVVTERRQEIGIRMALGAGRSTILKSVLGRASMYMGAGLAVGLLATLGLAGFVRGFLFEITPHDPRVYASVVTILVATGLMAAFVPAVRACRVDPMITLRLE